MKILIIDDQYEKIQFLVSQINQIGEAEITTAITTREAIDKIRKEKFNLCILDLQIPDTLGGNLNPTGGKSFLEYLEFNRYNNMPEHIISITSQEESYNSCINYFESKGWILINGIEDEERINSIIKTKFDLCKNEQLEIDYAIITALEHTELEAVLSFDFNWKKLPYKGDGNVYYQGQIININGESKTILATSCPRVGMAAAAATTVKVCMKFKPSMLIMTGIAASAKQNIKFGDILISDSSWDWGNGKQTVKNGERVHLQSPHQVALDSKIRAVIKNITTERKFVDDIYQNYKGLPRPNDILRVHLGPIVSGASVVEDPEIVNKIMCQHRNVIGVEMEAYGVLEALNCIGDYAPKGIIIKSVSDYANPKKNDKWQKYAAYTSSAFAFKLIEHSLLDI